MLRHPTEKLGGSYVGAKIGEMISSPLAVVLSLEQKKPMHDKNLFCTMSITDLLDRPSNQKRELEADAEGMRLMARAGYDAKAAIDLWGGERPGSQARTRHGELFVLPSRRHPEAGVSRHPAA